MVNLAQLKKPTPVVKKEKAEPEPIPMVAPAPSASSASRAPTPIKNLHRDPREQTAPKQFMLPPDVVMDFEIEARKQGFRRDSHFFLHVWAVYKASRS